MNHGSKPFFPADQKEKRLYNKRTKRKKRLRRSLISQDAV